MCLTQLKKAQLKVNEGLIEHFKQDNADIKELAENMAECATNIHGQGYSAFVLARDSFLKKLDTMLSDYTKFMSPAGIDPGKKYD